MGIPTWLAPHAFRILAAPPEARRSTPFMSSNFLMGISDMMFEVPHVYMVSTFTLENGFGLYLL